MDNENTSAKIILDAYANTSSIDEAIKKAEILRQKIQELKTMAVEFNSCISGLELEIDIH